MPSQADKRLNIKRAAGLIFRTAKPTAEQMQRVAEWIAQGELAGDSRGTTAAAVADFIARSALDRRNSGSRAAAARRHSAAHAEEMHDLYRQTLKQYFLAVLLRRKVHHASKRFRRAVLAGQIGLLLASLLLILASFRTFFPPLAPERAAVVEWLEANVEDYRLIKFHPTKYDENGNARVWVEYHYRTPQGRGVDTRRGFTIAGDRVVAVDSS